MRVLNDKVAIRKDEAKDTSDGGIVLLEGSKERPTEAMVVAVGTGRTTSTGVNIPPSISVGDRILINKFSGAAVEVDGETLHIIKEEEIIAIID